VLHIYRILHITTSDYSDDHVTFCLHSAVVKCVVLSIFFVDVVLHFSPFAFLFCFIFVCILYHWYVAKQ